MRYRHKKRGGTYTRLGDAPLQCAEPFTAAEGAIFTVYMAEASGKLYVRPINEFDDGRFEALPPERQPKPKPRVHAAVFAQEAAKTILTDMLVHLFENDEKIELMFKDYQPRVEAFLRRKTESRDL